MSYKLHRAKERLSQPSADGEGVFTTTLFQRCLFRAMESGGILTPNPLKRGYNSSRI
jgi:hypothetical protein